MKIIFMGTPEFSVPSLHILVESGYEVVAVVTATDKRGGRGGKKLLESAVKKYALKNGIPVLQPRNLKAPEFNEELASYKADLQVVVAFRMLPEVVWDMPNRGTINLHGSILPKYRGAAPINWAVINGDTETGLTTFFIEKQIDTGNLLFQAKLPIGPDETAGELHDRMKELGASLVLKTVKAIESGEYSAEKQDEQLVTKAPKIYTETCEINFDQTASDVHNFIRGLSPYPTAWTMLDDLKFKVFRTKKELATHRMPIGQHLTDNKSFLKFAVQDGFVHCLEVQLQGRKRMDIKSFLNGYTIE